MCLHAACSPSRLDASGDLRPFFRAGSFATGRSFSRGRTTPAGTFNIWPDLTEYHVEAAIAWAHTNAHRAEDTDWPMIVSLYGKLMAIRQSPVVALNRAIAIGQSEGPLRGLQELHAISNSERLVSYPFYHAALG